MAMMATGVVVGWHGWYGMPRRKHSRHRHNLHALGFTSVRTPKVRFVCSPPRKKTAFCPSGVMFLRTAGLAAPGTPTRLSRPR
eukprot:5619397-Lingulodinium_polyedra.AAC.1